MPTLRLLPELEDALRQVQGIRAASVVTGPDGTPTEIHVLASPGKPAKQLVRDVQSLAMARFDIDIDHRIVSVVQFDNEDVPEVILNEDDDEDEAAPRPAIASIMLRTSGQESEATVTVAAGGSVFEGKVLGPGAPSQRARLVAQATLTAVAELLGTTAEVESAAVVALGQREVALTILSVMVPRLGEQVVTGSALVRGDEADAVARSVLDALNRRLSG